MKKYLSIISIFAASVFALTSCDDEFLNRYPTTAFTEATVFSNYDQTVNYMVNFYKVFTETPDNKSNVHDSYFTYPGLFSHALTGRYSEDAVSGLVLDDYVFKVRNKAASYWNTGGYTWQVECANYTQPYMYIREINVLLNNLWRLKGNATDAQIAHVEAVSRFFRAYSHWSLLYNFGEAIYVDGLVSDNDEEALQAKPLSRTELADKIYDEYEWCIANIHDELCERNTVNSNVIKLAMIRFCLFEGTFRKYHSIADGSAKYSSAKLLQTVIDKGESLISIPLYTGGKDKITGEGYASRFTSEKLNDVQEALLYIVGDKTYSSAGNSGASSFADNDLPQWTVNLYLTEDGLPIHNSGVKYYDWDGGKYVSGQAYDYANCDVYQTFRKRDPRLSLYCCPPYSVKANNNSYEVTSVGKYNEYLSKFPSVVSANGGTVPALSALKAVNKSKALPLVEKGGPRVIGCCPNLVEAVTEQGAFDGTVQYWSAAEGVFSTTTGYPCWINYDISATSTADLSPNDFPVFLADEAYIAYAEAAFELGQFNQSVADKTVNKLRTRAGAGKMDVSKINASFDPDSPSGVDPVLWEIRRERLIELMGQNFSAGDARRWKMGPWFAGQQCTGVWIARSDVDKIDPLKTKDTSNPLMGNDPNGGHIYIYGDPAGWDDKLYYMPVPTNQVFLNPNLKAINDNNGWK